MNKYYFTFMQKQHDTRGRSYASYYLIIEAETEIDARRKYIDRFGDQWAGVYYSAEDAGVERFGLRLWNLEALEDDPCCGVPQDQYLELKKRVEKLQELLDGRG